MNVLAHHDERFCWLAGENLIGNFFLLVTPPACGFSSHLLADGMMLQQHVVQLGGEAAAGGRRQAAVGRGQRARLALQPLLLRLTQLRLQHLRLERL